MRTERHSPDASGGYAGINVARSDDRSRLALIERLQPDPRVLDVLRGVISEPVTTLSYKDPSNPQEATVSLVESGAGLWGLTDVADSRTWAGIQNHTWLSTRLALDLAAQAKVAGANVNLQTLLDGGLASHAGRRQWDEAGWYKDAPLLAQSVADGANGDLQTLADARRSVTNEVLGMRIIKDRVSDEALSLAVALGHGVDEEEFGVNPSIYNSFEYRIFILADHRTGQDFGSLEDRMGQFVTGVFMGRDVESAQKAEVLAQFADILEQRRVDIRAGKWRAITKEEAVARMTGLGVNSDSARLSLDMFMGLMLNDADTEVMLEQMGIDLSNLTPETVPMQPWESDIRRVYMAFAKDGILARLDELHSTGDEKAIEVEFPAGNWWGAAARDLYAAHRIAF